MAGIPVSVFAQQLLLWIYSDQQSVKLHLSDKQRESLRRLKLLNELKDDKTLWISSMLRTGVKVPQYKQREVLDRLSLHLEKPIFNYGGKGTVSLGAIAVNITIPKVFLTHEPCETPPLPMDDLFAFYKENLMQYTHGKSAFLNVGGQSLFVPITTRCVVVDKLPIVFNPFDNFLAYSPIAYTNGINIELNPFKDALLKSWLRVPLVIAAWYKTVIGFDMPRIDVFKFSRVKLIGGGYFTPFAQRLWKLMGFDFVDYVDPIKLAFRDNRRQEHFPIDRNRVHILGNDKKTKGVTYDYVYVAGPVVAREQAAFIHSQVMNGAYLIVNRNVFENNKLYLTEINNTLLQNVAGPFVYVDAFPDFDRDKETIEEVANRFERDYYSKIRHIDGVITKVHDALDINTYGKLSNGKCFADVYTGKDRNGKHEFMYMNRGVQIDVNKILNMFVIYAQDSMSNTLNPKPTELLGKLADREYVVTYPMGNYEVVNSMGTPSPFHTINRSDYTLVSSDVSFAPFLLLAQHIGLIYGVSLSYTTNIPKIRNYVDIGYAGKTAGELLRFLYDMNEDEYHLWRERVVADVCKYNNIYDDYGPGFGGHAANELLSGVHISTLLYHIIRNKYPHKEYEYRRAIIFYLFMCRFLKIEINKGCYNFFGLTKEDVAKVIAYSNSFIYPTHDLQLLLKPLEFKIEA